MLNNSYRMLFSSRFEALIAFNAQSIIFWMVCLQIHTAEDVIRQVGQQDH